MLNPFPKYSQYPVVGRISAKGIKNVLNVNVVFKKIVSLHPIYKSGVLAKPPLTKQGHGFNYHLFRRTRFDHASV